jgi:hypothetical protein
VTVSIEVGSGITVTESNGSTFVSEDGTTDSYTIGLQTVPTGTVQIAVTADAQTRVSADGANFFASVIVSLTNKTPQTITVKAIDDTTIQGRHTNTIHHTVTGTIADPNYTRAVAIPSITVSVADDDAPFQNQNNPLDVNDSGIVSAIDALTIINYINVFGGATGNITLVKGQLPVPDPTGGGKGKGLFLDTSPDNMVSAGDVLAVINYLNAHPTGGGEGEDAASGLELGGDLMSVLALDAALQPKRRK